MVFSFCLAVTIVLSALAWSFNVLSFDDAKMTVFWPCLFVLLVFRSNGTRSIVAGLRAWLPAWLGLFVVAASSFGIAHVPALSMAGILRGGGLLVFATLAWGMTQSPRGRRGVFAALLGGGFLVAVLALGQQFGLLNVLFPAFDHYDQAMYGVFGNQALLGGYLALAILMIPAVFGAGQRNMSTWKALLGLFLVAVMFLALILSESRGGQLALLVGTLAWLATGRVTSQRSVRLAIVAVGVGILIVVLAGGASQDKWFQTAGDTDRGSQVRSWIWSGSMQMGLAHPVRGVGVGNFAYWAPSYMGDVPATYHNERTTYHAHFDLLEFWCETGLVGLVFLVGQFSRFRLRSGPAFGAMMALIVFSCFQPAWASTPHAMAFLLLLGMNLRSSVPRYVPDVLPIASNRPYIGLVVVTVVGGMLYGALVLRPSFLLRRAEDRHLAGQEAGPDYEKAVSAGGFQGEAQESYGMYLLGQGRPDAALTSFRVAQKELDTGRLYFLMYEAATALGDEESAGQYREACLARWPWATSRFLR